MPIMMGPFTYRAIADVMDERRRQIEVEGFGPDHDDEHDTGELAAAAGCYAEFASLPDDLRAMIKAKGRPPRSWPWHKGWWKPTTRRKDLIKVAALAIAEIERIDRAAA